VLIIGERSGYYSPPPLIRAATIYDTPTTVRVRRPDGKEETQSQHKVWAVPDDAAWTEIEVASAVFATALAEYADVLRELGRYADQLDAAGGMKGAPNPLCATVARSEDPDHTHHSTWFLTAWFVPYLERKAVDRHTPKMLVKEQWGNFAQDDSFVLADDAAWERVSAAQQACKDAATAAEQLLHRLGTYDEALDGRHQKQPAPAALSEAELAAADRLAAIQAQIAALGYTLRQDHQGLAVMDGAVMLIGVGANNVEELGRQVAQLAPLDDLAAPLARAGAGMRAAAAAQEAAALGDAGEDLGAHLMAAVGAILGGLPEPAVRILAAHLCFGDVSDVAFTAPIEAIYDGFAEVASQGDAARMPLAWRAGARAALATLGLTGMPQKAAAD
jgi:hypothetical protein